METPTRAPGYDLFKLIVALILLILALILMWASPSQSSASLLITPSIALIASPTVAPASQTSSPLTVTPSSTAPQIFELTATPLPSSLSPPPTETPFLPPSPTGTEVAEPTTTPPPLPTMTSVPEATATPIPSETAAPTVCEVATSRSRLHVGADAIIVRRLNFRSSPGIRDNWLLTNVPGTRVQVVGGPECVPYWTGAYLWWQIKLPDGSTGWSAEDSLHGSFYFMEPK